MDSSLNGTTTQSNECENSEHQLLMTQNKSSLLTSSPVSSSSSPPTPPLSISSSSPSPPKSFKKSCLSNSPSSSSSSSHNSIDLGINQELSMNENENNNFKYNNNSNINKRNDDLSNANINEHKKQLKALNQLLLNNGLAVMSTQENFNENFRLNTYDHMDNDKQDKKIELNDIKSLIASNQNNSNSMHLNRNKYMLQNYFQSHNNNSNNINTNSNTTNNNNNNNIQYFQQQPQNCLPLVNHCLNGSNLNQQNFQLSHQQQQQQQQYQFNNNNIINNNSNNYQSNISSFDQNHQKVQNNQNIHQIQRANCKNSEMSSSQLNDFIPLMSNYFFYFQI